MRFILSTLFCLLLSSYQLMASTKATVSSVRANVYANPELTVPIGYLLQGQVVEVGDKYLNRDRAISVIISGKMAYLKTADLLLGDETEELKEERTLVVSRPIPDPEYIPMSSESTLYKRAFAFSYHQVNINGSMKGGLGNKGTAQQADITAEFWPWKMLGFSVGGHYLKVNGTVGQLNSVGGQISQLISLPIFSFFSLNGMASAFFSPSPFTWEVASGTTYSGQTFGVQYGGFLGLKIKSVEIRVGAGYFQIQCSKLTHQYIYQYSSGETVSSTRLSPLSTNSLQAFASLALYF